MFLPQFGVFCDCFLMTPAMRLSSNGSYVRAQNAKCVYYVITDTFKFLKTKVTFFSNSAFEGGNSEADIILVLIVL